MGNKKATRERETLLLVAFYEPCLRDCECGLHRCKKDNKTPKKLAECKPKATTSAAS